MTNEGSARFSLTTASGKLLGFTTYDNNGDHDVYQAHHHPVTGSAQPTAKGSNIFLPVASSPNPPAVGTMPGPVHPRNSLIMMDLSLYNLFYLAGPIQLAQLGDQVLLLSAASTIN